MSLYNVNSGYGGVLANQIANAVGQVMGRLLIVQEDSDPDEIRTIVRETFQPDAEGRIKYYSSLESAYEEAVSNANDVILISAHSSHGLSDVLTVAKNRIHFIGMDGGDRLIQQGAKIQLTTPSTDAVSTIKVTGTRNTFRNLKITNSGTHANSVSAVIGDGDEGTLWKNCTFQKLSDLNVAAVSNFEIRSDSATFLDCEFGGDTYLLTATRPNLWIKASGATRMKNCRFRGCTFIAANTDAGNLHVDVEDTSSLAFYNVMENCNFINSIISSQSAIQATVAVASVGSLVEGTLHFINPYSNAASFCTTSDQFLIYGPEKAVAATTGLAVTPA